MWLRAPVQGLLRPPALKLPARYMMPFSDRQVSPCSTADAGGLEVFGLDPTLLPQALAIRDWLLAEAAQLTDPGQILTGRDRGVLLAAAAVPVVLGLLSDTSASDSPQQQA